jgi:hypothetical protein
MPMMPVAVPMTMMAMAAPMAVAMAPADFFDSAIHIGSLLDHSSSGVSGSHGLGRRGCGENGRTDAEQGHGDQFAHGYFFLSAVDPQLLADLKSTRTHQIRS